MPDPLWTVVPFRDLWPLTEQTALDLLTQTVPTRVLLIDQGSGAAANGEARAFAEAHHPQVLLLSWNPPLPSLSGAWNRALSFVWEVGGTEALVVNSDVRLLPDTVKVLQHVRTCLAHDQPEPLLVSAVGVTDAQFAEAQQMDGSAHWLSLGNLLTDRGGPDYSCFLMTQSGHWKYPFDERFVPAFLEDLDSHRRMMLGGDGARCFSVNLPFHHIGGGSQTLKAMTPEARDRFNRQRAASLEYYRAKWLGGPNEERATRPFDPTSEADGVTTPDLQERERLQHAARV